ncbi:MAG: fibronectin type III domain-containing protein, partial [Candidatus Nanopelagicales bacterium]
MTRLKLPVMVLALTVGAALMVSAEASQATDHLKLVANTDVLPAGSYCQGPQADQPAVGPKKVIMLDLENESTTRVKASPDAPFQNHVLSQQCGTFSTTSMHSTTHPSESNYFAQVSGLNAAITSGPDAAARFGLSDCPPDSTSSSCTFGGGHFDSSVPSIFSQIEQQVGTSGWKTYADDMVTNCETADDSAYATTGGVTYRKYAVRHNPAVFFNGIACPTQVVPSGNWQGGQGPLYGDLMSGSMPEFSFIVPNDIENGHDPVSVNGVTVAGGTSQIGNADNYLSSLMAMIQASPDYQSGNLMVLVTYDEGNGSGMPGDGAVGQNCADPATSPLATSCQVATWIVGRYVPSHTYTGYMNQFGLLAASQRLLGLSPLLGHAGDSATPDIVAGTPTDPDPFNLLPTGPPAAPAPPTIGTATAGDSSAVISFAPPAGAWPPVTSFSVTSNPGGVMATGTTSPIPVSGLTNGTSYTFTVTATNAVGTSPASAESGSVTPAAVTTPGPPTGLTAVPGNNQVALSWSPPASDGGSAVTDYVIQYALAGTGAWQTVSDGVSTATSAMVTGLTGGTSYDFQVAALNGTGQGPSSSIVTASPTAASPELLPDPGFELGNGGWTPFIVGSFSRVNTPTHGGSSALQIAATSSSPTYVGMTQNNVVNNSVGGTTYTASCYVQPTGPNLNLQLRFLEYTQNYGSHINLSASIVSNLPVGTWTLVKVSSAAVNSGERIIPQIYATNETTNTGSLIYDDCSVVSSVAPPSVTAPSAPVNVSAIPGDRTATVSFSAPAATGGSPVTGYTVTSSPGGVSVSGASSPIAVSGLTNGTHYTFTVTARNVVGAGPPSAPSNSVVPAGLPGAPTGLVPVAGDGQVALSWTAPGGNGSAVTDYVVQYRVSGTSPWLLFNDGVSTATTATV